MLGRTNRTATERSARAGGGDGERAREEQAREQSAPPPARPSVVVVGRDWLGQFTAIRLVRWVPPDGVVLLTGIAHPRTRALESELRAVDGCRLEQPAPRGRLGTRQVADGLHVKVVLSAGEEEADRNLAADLVKYTGACLYGATCAEGGWAGPAVPRFFAPGHQNPRLALPLAEALDAAARDLWS